MIIKGRGTGAGTPRVRIASSVGRRLGRVAGFLGWTGVLFLAAVWLDPWNRLASWIEAKGFDPAAGRSHKQELLKIPVNWLASHGSAGAVPSMALDIKFKHMQRLRQLRDEALELGAIIHGGDEFVPAVIRVGAQAYSGEVRLKGDLLDHLRGNKWSLRVHVEDGGKAFGMRRFSLQAPGTRDYHGEPLYFKAARQLGIIAPRYFFVNLTLNGERIGIMALEEHFALELLEAEGRLPGVILKFDESYIWYASGVDPGPAFKNYRNAAIVPFEPAATGRSPELSAYLRTATGLLRAFVAGDLPASRVFDPELMGRYIALAETWGSWHSIHWNNLRFYYNPVTARLEPIAYDGNVGHPWSADDLVSRRDPIIRDVLADSTVGAAYVRTLKRLQAALGEGRLKAELRAGEDRYLVQLWRDYPALRGFDWDRLDARAGRMLSRIPNDYRPASTAYENVLHAFAIEDGATRYLEFASAVPESVEVTALRWVRTGGTESPPMAAQARGLPMWLEGTPVGGTPRLRRLSYDPSPEADDFQLVVHARIAGQPKEYLTAARPYHPRVASSPVPRGALADALARHPFLRARSDGGLEVRPGRWNVDQSLVIPPGIALHASGGTTLSFAAGAALIVQGPLTLDGLPGAPVVLQGQHGGVWQGVAALQSTTRSRWTHVVVRHAAGIALGNWQLPAGVTFYEASALLVDCVFEDSRAADALRFVRTTFGLRGVAIRRASGGGVAASFSSGVIQDGRWEDVGVGGSTALDVNTSRIILRGGDFLGVGRAISVGQAGRLVAHDIDIVGAHSGVTSRDGATVELTGLRIIRADAGLIALRERPEYDLPSLLARVVWNEATAAVQAVPGSTVVVNGVPIGARVLDRRPDGFGSVTASRRAE